MKIGRVARIRVNPKDCMAVVDVLKKLDIVPRGMSFSQGVSVVLSSALESFRQSGLIPIRDGFEFSQLLEVFPPDRPADRARKLEITEIMSAHKAPALIPETPDRKRRRLRFEELKFKKEHDDLNWTEALQEEFRPLVDEFFNF